MSSRESRYREKVMTPAKSLQKMSSCQLSEDPKVMQRQFVSGTINYRLT